MEKKKIEKEYRQTETGKKNYRNATIFFVVAIILGVVSIVFEIANNDKISDVFFSLEDLFIPIWCCFEFYYLGGLKEFEKHYNKNK